MIATQLLEWFAVALAGSLGGIVNSYLETRTLTLPHKLDRLIFDPGTLGNVIVGSFAAIITWGLYTPLASFADTDIRVSVVTAALLAGLGGARLLSSYVERAVAEENLRRVERALARLTEYLERRFPDDV